MSKYECDQCGACCQGLLIIEADSIDLQREPRLIEADACREGQTVEETLSDLEESGQCLVIAGRCRFLSRDCLCSIYPTRPNACVGMQAGDHQCQEVRRLVGLPQLEPIT